jgi:hypothetical protein
MERTLAGALFDDTGLLEKIVFDVPSNKFSFLVKVDTDEFAVAGRVVISISCAVSEC